MNLSKDQMEFLAWVRRVSFFRDDFIKDARQMGYGRDKSVALAYSGSSSQRICSACMIWRRA